MKQIESSQKQKSKMKRQIQKEAPPALEMKQYFRYPANMWTF